MRKKWLFMVPVAILGMLLVAFIVTPWASIRLLKREAEDPFGILGYPMALFARARQRNARGRDSE